MSNNIPSPISSKIQEQALKELIRKRELIRSDLERTVGERPTVPESIFVTYFLPLFCGEHQGDRSELMGYWNSIAGGMMNEVDVVSEDRKIVAVVPPIFNREMVKTTTARDAVPIANFIDQVRGNSATSNAAADNIINNELVAKFVAPEPGPEQVVLAASWEKLLNHYGKYMPGQKGAPTTGSASSASSGESDFEM